MQKTQTQNFLKGLLIPLIVTVIALILFGVLTNSSSDGLLDILVVLVAIIFVCFYLAFRNKKESSFNYIVDRELKDKLIVVLIIILAIVIGVCFIQWFNYRVIRGIKPVVHLSW